MQLKPRTQYAQSGHINIAYQVIGEGSMNIVYIPGWVSNIDMMWYNPELSDFLNQLSKVGRVILFDKRGTGLSDRISDLSTLEERMDDIRAVMDAVGSEEAILFGHSEGGSASLLFAATYPERTKALISFGVFAKRRYAEDYPWAPTDEERQAIYDMIEQDWGSGDMDLASLAPSKADDPVFMDWLASYFRSGASPRAALVLTKMNTDVDIIDVLDTIQVPTLLMQRTHDIDVKIEEGRFIADKIKGAIFKEFDGNDHLFWAGNTEEVLDEMITFMSSLSETEIHKPIETLSTVLNLRLIDKRMYLMSLEVDKRKKIFEAFQQMVFQAVSQFKGRIEPCTRVGYFACFDGAIKAVECAALIKERVKTLNLQTRMGLHTGPVYINSDGLLDGQAVAVVHNIQENAETNDILMTKAVQALLLGSGIEYVKEKNISIPPIKTPYEIYNISESDLQANYIGTNSTLTSPASHSLLEQVLSIINHNLSNEYFSIEDLCHEIGISERSLQRKLKASTNRSPNQMIRSYRLHRAKDILIKEDCNVSEVAERTGFSSPSYFSKCFRKEFGCLPTEMVMV